MVGEDTGCDRVVDVCVVDREVGVEVILLVLMQTEQLKDKDEERSAEVRCLTIPWLELHALGSLLWACKHMKCIQLPHAHFTNLLSMMGDKQCLQSVDILF